MRRVAPEDAWRMENTHGAGHHTRVVSQDDFEAVVVQFD
jgi:hypothetical protein